jgi:Glycosyl transferase family 2
VSSHPTRNQTSAGAASAAGRLPLSVVIPVYNRPDMLRRSLASVWSQRPALPAEVIVVDDGSQDETAAVAEELRATVIRHPQNRGLSAARNTGLDAASYPWIALLDSDDEWLPHHLDLVWRLRGRHVLAASSSLNCGADPARDRFRGPVARKPVLLRSGDQLVFPENVIPVSASLFQRELALRVGGFRPHRGVVEDFDMWLRLLEHGTGICSPEVGIIYHVHDDQMSLQNARTMQLAHIEAAEAHRERTGGSATAIRRWEGVSAWDNLRRTLAAHQRREALRWALYAAARPQRMVGVLWTWAWRYLTRRRSARMQAEGLRWTPRGTSDIAEPVGRPE